MSNILFISFWLGAQLLMAVFLFLLSSQQANWLLYMRQNVGRPNNLEAPLHKYNLGMRAFVALLLNAFQLIYGQWYQALLFGILMLPLNWLLFDLFINKAEGNDPNYIGSGAVTDQQLASQGKNAGKIKNGICLALIVLINLSIILKQFLMPG